MAFLVSFEELKKVLNGVSRVNDDKAVVKVVLGLQVVGDNVACACKVLGGTEEVAVKFLAKKPENFDGTPIQGAFKNTAFTTVINSLASLKEAVVLDINEGIARVGIINKAMTSLPLLGESDIPTGVPVDKDSTITRFFAEQKELLALLRGGGFATANSDKDQRGVSNATLVVGEDALTLYSCNETGSILGVASCAVKLSDIPEGDTTKRALWCKDKGVENLVIPIPKKVVINMINMLDGEGKCSVIITDKVVVLMPNDSTQYIAVVGAKAFTAGLALINNINNMPTKGIIVVDNEKLRLNLSMIQSFSSIVSKKLTPVEIGFYADKMTLSSTTGDGKVVVDVVGSNVTEPVTRFLDAEKVNNLVGVLAKGNLRIEVREQENCPLLFTNGTVEQATGNCKALIAPVQKPAEPSDDSATEE